MVVNEDERMRLAQQVELLGSRDRRARRAAYEELEWAGEAALDAVIEGLGHPNALVRRFCAKFMDHHADDRCVEPLRAALHDAVPRVRWEAVHSLGCQRCKPSPLDVDALPIFIERALNDTNKRVRLSALHGINLQPRDPRAVAPLEAILERESDPVVRRVAHRALRHHDPAYRAVTDEMARARTTQDQQ